MSDERYVIGLFKGEPAVLDTSQRVQVVVARCGIQAYAEMVAAALNAHGLQVRR